MGGGDACVRREDASLALCPNERVARLHVRRDHFRAGSYALTAITRLVSVDQHGP